ncbi:iron-siderophore ABC transporter substrate-binding protein [Pectobacterium parvum]|uniref:ABC transporter substrate-binding protein n=1 Tax=Pectobacterium TaxID=122277 RepID=UPI00057EECAF|nr:MULTISPECIES: iron-siderophore ABC transporter substrate-binding protein [Pectobacterium]KHS99978.1 iron ABC transporter substrate-binding protein [Pectobacterium parvum]UFK38035.1 iron-siderophore ABC transporter substrate-binding protein [Pectobacterium parvum]
MISKLNRFNTIFSSATRQRFTLAVLLSFLLVTLVQAAEVPRQIRHALGVTTVTGTPLRIVTLFQGATDSAVALGIQPIGVVESWTEKPIYRYLRPALQGVTLVGLETQPSLETIALLKPDLIVASTFRHEKIYGLLSQIAPTIALDRVSEFKETVQMMGVALNREEKANEILSHWDRRVDALRDRLKSQFSERWPLSVSILEFREDHMRSYLPASFAGSVLSEIGFVWSRPESYTSGVMQKLTSKESIPVVDADLFFVLLRSDKPAVAQNYRDWQAHPLWQRLHAPQQQQVYPVDNVAWSLSGGILGANNMLDDIERQFAGKAEFAGKKRDAAEEIPTR